MAGLSPTHSESNCRAMYDLNYSENSNKILNDSNSDISNEVTDVLLTAVAHPFYKVQLTAGQSR